MNYKTFRETLQNITEATASMQAKAAAKKLMIKLYGKGTVTFESHSGGHFVEHESEGGDAHAHTFNPVTGKISKTPHVTSSFYGESVTNRQNITEGKATHVGDFVFSTKQAKAAAKQLGAKLIATTVGEDGYEGFEYHLLQKGNLFSIVSYAYGDYSGLDGDPGPNTVKDFIAQTKMGNHSGEGQFQSKQALLSSFSQIFDDHDKQAEAFMRSKLK